MADNILKKQLDCISEDFLRGVYAEATRPMRGALTHMFGRVTTGRSTLVTDIAGGHTRARGRGEDKVHQRKTTKDL